MPSLPVISGTETVKVFQKFGWEVARQSSSHIIMTKEGEIASLSISKSSRGRTRNVTKSDSLCKSNR